MNLLRRAAELAGRGVVIRRTMKVGRNVVPLFVTPDAQLKYLKPGDQGFDRDLIDIAQRHLVAESVVWDIGANVGTFTFAAASIAVRGQVVAVEADNWLATLLRRSIALQRHDHRNVAVLSVAAAGRVGVERFMIAERGRASNALVSAGGRSQMGGVREIQHVPALTLDSMLDVFDAPTFVKIDVEGAEDAVLSGASRLLSDVRPKVYMEIGEDKCDAICALMAAFRYRPCGADGRDVDPVGVDNVLWMPS